ncbi:MAG: YdcF family protein [Lachnospiraceae bacterium]|nr:YdcF family protein [Lachnospiraceae bacterium]
MSFSFCLPGKRRSDLEELERSLSVEKVSFKERIKKLERSKGMQVFLWITMGVLLLYAVFAFLYSTVVLYASGPYTSFLWFWPVTCVVALIGAVLLFLVVTGRLWRLKTAAMCLCGLFWLCMVVFLSVEAVVFFAGRKAPEANAEYVIVLGAQVRGETPTLVLNARINAAAEYLREHPEAVCVASGGQGTGEAISEAEAIRRGLLRLGISDDRILLEDRSTSTAENLKFSAEVIQKYEKGKALSDAEAAGELSGTAKQAGTEKAAIGNPVRFMPKNVVLVTNDFHVYRATKLAENAGYMHVSGLGATDFFAVTIQYYVREFFAIVKESLSGNFS